MSSNKAATKADLQEMYSRILPYLGGSADAGFTPVGTIISVMGVTAPANYLACNGQTVNISDYPELADYFLAEFGSKSKFGGNGTTTFGIPDLRGEFLRGTGTNSHANNGDGADVGVHQDGTKEPLILAGSSAIYMQHSAGSATNVDKALGNSTQIHGVANPTGSSTGSYTTHYTVRPTNTSVLYCIAVKNIYYGASGDYYTKSESNSLFVPKSALQNGFLFMGTASFTLPKSDYGTLKACFTNSKLLTDMKTKLAQLITNANGSFTHVIPSNINLGTLGNLYAKEAVANDNPYDATGITNIWGFVFERNVGNGMIHVRLDSTTSSQSANKFVIANSGNTVTSYLTDTDTSHLSADITVRYRKYKKL